VKDFKSYPGLTTDISDADLIKLAEKVCDTIGVPGITYDNLVATISTTKFGPRAAPVLVNAANRSYCPGRQYAATAQAEAATVSAYQDTPQATASGPLTTFGEGTYEVGTGDGQVAPGKYKSPGPGYWARLRSSNGSDIIANDLKDGPMVLTVLKTDKYVEISRCTFTKV
jgi:hypothetical protein